MILELNDNEKSLIATGRIIEAIKSLRERTYCGLLEAKTTCDNWRDKCGPFIWKVTLFDGIGRLTMTVRARTYEDAVGMAFKSLAVVSVVRES